METLLSWIKANCKFAKPTALPRRSRPKTITYPNQTEDEQYNAAETYFNIGHGTDSDDPEVSSDPKTHQTWVLLGGDEIDSRPGDFTHGMVWGHDYCGKTYKGRYEGDTGRLAVVPPSNAKSQLVPSWLSDLLQQHFGFISEVHVF